MATKGLFSTRSGNYKEIHGKHTVKTHILAGITGSITIFVDGYNYFHVYGTASWELVAIHRHLTS